MSKEALETRHAHIGEVLGTCSEHARREERLLGHRSVSRARRDDQDQSITAFWIGCSNGHSASAFMMNGHRKCSSQGGCAFRFDARDQQPIMMCQYGLSDCDEFAARLAEAQHDLGKSATELTLRVDAAVCELGERKGGESSQALVDIHASGTNVLEQFLQALMVQSSIPGKGREEYHSGRPQLPLRHG